jgi:hypothetical protein
MSPDEVRALRGLAGDRPYDVCVGGRRRREDEEAEREWIRGVAEAGATWWCEFVPAAERDAMRTAVERGPLRID